jgi:outer membrane protein
MYSKRLKTIFLCLTFGLSLFAQNDKNAWSLDKCISYAWSKNIDVQKIFVTTEIEKQNLKQKEGLRYPNLTFSVSQGLEWDKTLNSNNRYGDYASYNSTSASLSSSLTLFNGFKISNNIKLAKLSYKASLYDKDTQRESVSLSVLNDYLQVIYAKELVNTCREDVKSTEEQLKLADERIKLGLLSKADYLQIKAQLTSDKLTLTNAQNSYDMAKLELMQLMEIPVNSEFDIVYPDLASLSENDLIPNAESVYQKALSVKPQVKSANLNTEAAQMNVKVAQAQYYPSLVLNGSVSTGYNSSLSNLNYDYQLSNRLTPGVNLTLSVPILQQKQVETAVKIAKLNTQTAALNEQSIHLQLRKSIEQACLDANAAKTKYEASLEMFNAMKEAYEVAVEKYSVGLLSSSDFIVQKTKYISAESDLLQARFNLLFCKKIVDFYLGNPITL